MKRQENTTGSPGEDGKRILSAEEARIAWWFTTIVKESRDLLSENLIIDLLSETATYSSQDHDEVLSGKQEISDYLVKRYRFLREAAKSGRDMGAFLPATVNLPEVLGYPCLVYVQKEIRYAIWVVKVTESREISGIQIITRDPSPDSAVLTDHETPGFSS